MVAAVLMVAMSAQAFATSKTVSVTEAGTLSTLIPASEKNAITSLTVSGTLNGTGIRFIREMAGLDIEGETTDGKLTELNIAGIELTDGGDAYYEDAWSKYYTATSYDVSEDNDLYYCTDLSYAFTGTNLTKVVWPATMWEVSENALAYCSDLKEFVLGSGMNTVGESMFYYANGLESIDVPEGYTSIGYEAFASCSALKSVTLPSTINAIAAEAFYGCSALESFTIKVAAPIAITADVFEDVDLNTCVLNVPEEGVEAYKADAQWGKFKNINGIMPSGVNDVVSSIDANVSVADGVLTIDGAQGDISVYNIGGVRLANGSVRLSVTLSKGVYIVTLNGKATKVIVK